MFSSRAWMFLCFFPTLVTLKPKCDCILNSYSESLSVGPQTRDFSRTEVRKTNLESTLYSLLSLLHSEIPEVVLFCKYRQIYIQYCCGINFKSLHTTLDCLWGTNNLSCIFTLNQLHSPLCAPQPVHKWKLWVERNLIFGNFATPSLRRAAIYKWTSHLNVCGSHLTWVAVALAWPQCK